MQGDRLTHPTRFALSALRSIFQLAKIEKLNYICAALNTNEPTQNLPSQPDAPDTAVLLKELLYDLRAFRDETRQQLQTIEGRLEAIESRLTNIEREQHLSRIELREITANQSQQNARLISLERSAA